MDISFDILDTLPRNCWVNIDTAQLTQNVRMLGKTIARPVLVAIKANGYGHGYLNAAKAFLAGGARYLAVATISEGLLLRRFGITAPILIICGILPDEMVLAAQAGIEFFIWQHDHIDALRTMPRSTTPIRVHLEVDTGMGRGGCLPQDVVQIGQALQKIPSVETVGLCTHFASADMLDIDDTNKQIASFNQAIDAMKAAGIKPPLLHAANSPGSLYYPQARYNMVRFGITAYGIAPDEGLPIPDGVKPAFSWHARLTSSKILPAGHGVGYGSEYIMPAEGRIGVVPVGYGDGFRRTPKKVNSVLIDGQERKTLGRICMDQCMIDLTGCGDITGAEVTLIGQQGDKQITAEDLARRWNTNPYDVYVGVAARVPRRNAEAS